MMRSMEGPMRVITIAILGISSVLAAQTAPQQEDPALRSRPSQGVPVTEDKSEVVVPAGTKVLLVLKNTISSKSAKKGDGVYLESSFPITQDGRVVIPAG